MHTNPILEIAIATGVRLALRRQAPISGAALEHAPCRFRPATKRFRAHHPCDRPGQHGCGWPSQRRRSWQPWSDSCERADPSGIDASRWRGEHRAPRINESLVRRDSRSDNSKKRHGPFACKRWHEMQTAPTKRQALVPRYSRRAKLSLCGIRALLFAAVRSAATSITRPWRRVLHQQYLSHRSGELLAFGEHGQSGLTVSSI
jgi:hypothetical protein